MTKLKTYTVMKLICIYLTLLIQICNCFTNTRLQSSSSLSLSSNKTTSLNASLKPAAIPLLDSGKALARSGELLIETTTILNLYGGGLSATGANIRNAGDCIAQAAASCRFKTGAELVCDELRESATCFTYGVEKLNAAVEEASFDKNEALGEVVQSMIPYLEQSGVLLEKAGASIQQRSTIEEIGESLFQCGVNLQYLSESISKIGSLSSTTPASVKIQEAMECSQRMSFAALKMKEAGDNLRGIVPEKPKGKAWLKG